MAASIWVNIVVPTKVMINLVYDKNATVLDKNINDRGEMLFGLVI